MMGATKEKQAMLDLLKEVCELAEAGGLEFGYGMQVIYEQEDYWAPAYHDIQTGPANWHYTGEECPMVSCLAAPGLKIEIGMVLCVLRRDNHYRCTPWPNRRHTNWLSVLRGVPLGLRYRLNRALKPLVKRRIRDAAREQQEADEKAARVARIKREQAILKSMKGQGWLLLVLPKP